MASFMPSAYIRSPRRCQGAGPKQRCGKRQNRPKQPWIGPDAFTRRQPVPAAGSNPRLRFAEKSPENANVHEQRARVHPAQPSYSVVVPAPELSSIDVAVPKHMGTIRRFRKGDAARAARSVTAALLAPLVP